MFFAESTYLGFFVIIQPEKLKNREDNHGYNVRLNK